MRQSTRLILNTGATYVRMALTVGLGLLATRWALHTLGDVDFGIRAGLTASVSMLLVISEGVSTSVERFLAFEIGRGAEHRKREFFGSAVVVMIGLALLAVAVGVPLGKVIIAWAIQGDPNIPAARATGQAVFWAYLAILGGLGFQIASTPFRAMFLAHQSIAILTLIDTLDSVLNLLAVCVAVLAPPGADRLLWLCLALLAGQAATSLAVAALCLRTYPESRSGAGHFSRSAVRELGAFTGWSMLGTVSYRIRMAGVPMLLLGAFGSVIAGGYALASQIAGYQLNLSSAIGKAAQPAVTQATGRGDHDMVRRLIPSVNKFATLLALFYLVPLTIETGAALNLWLSHKDSGAAPFPPQTATFVRLTLLIMGLPWIYAGYHSAIFADGRIKKYMISAVIIEAVGLLIAIVAALKFGAPPWAVPAIALGTSMFAVVYWVVHISGVLQIPVQEWLTQTWRPVLLVAIPATAVTLACSALLPGTTPDLVRLLVVTAAYAIVAMPLIWFFAVSPSERPHLQRLLSAAAARFGPRGPGNTPPGGDDTAPPA